MSEPRARLRSLDLTLYLILDPAALPSGRQPLEVARTALDVGVRIIQLRDKLATAASLIETTRALVALCDEHDALCIVNDRLDVALVAGAHGVHLGPHDLPVDAARRVAPSMVIGASAGDATRAASLEGAGADYLGVGALFDARASKPDASAPRGVEILSAVRAAVSCPLIGIGGIDQTTIAQVIAAGADGAAVIRAICAAPDPQGAAHALLQAASSGRSSR